MRVHAARTVHAGKARERVRRGAHSDVCDSGALCAGVRDACRSGVARRREVDVDALEEVVHVDALAARGKERHDGLVGRRRAARALGTAKARRGCCEPQGRPSSSACCDGCTNEHVRQEAPRHDVDAVIWSGVGLRQRDGV